MAFRGSVKYNPATALAKVVSEKGPGGTEAESALLRTCAMGGPNSNETHLF